MAKDSSKDEIWNKQIEYMQKELNKEEPTLIHFNTYKRLLEKLEEFKTIKELKPFVEEMERIIKYELTIWN